MTLRIPVASPELGQPEWEALREVVESGWVTQGPRVAAFEEAVAAFCGATHAVAVSSCTAALHLALVGHGIGEGDEVVLPSLSFIATANAVMHTGATPVFAEVDRETLNLDLDDVVTRLTPRTKAILLVHQLGLPADLQAFTSLAHDHGLALIEDAACAIGSRYRGTPVGGYGNTTCFSFHPRKVITTGDGGMVLTESQDFADRLRLLRQHGMAVPDTLRHTSPRVIRETYPEVGYNYRLTDVQAAMGVTQLDRLPHLLSERKVLAARYDALLADHPAIHTPVVPNDVEWNVQSYSVRLEATMGARDAVMQRLLDQGIATRPGIMTAHREPAYDFLPPISLPASENLSDTCLILPLHLKMSREDVADVVEALVAAVDEVTG